MHRNCCTFYAILYEFWQTDSNWNNETSSDKIENLVTNIFQYLPTPMTYCMNSDKVVHWQSESLDLTILYQWNLVRKYFLVFISDEELKPVKESPQWGYYNHKMLHLTTDAENVTQLNVWCQPLFKIEHTPKPVFLYIILSRIKVWFVYLTG